MEEKEKQFDDVLPARVIRFGNVAYLVQYLGVTTIARLSHDSRRETRRALPTDRCWLGVCVGGGGGSTFFMSWSSQSSDPPTARGILIASVLRYVYVCVLVQFGAFLFIWASASLQFTRRSAASFSALSRTLMRPNPVRKSPTAKSLTPGAGSCRAAQPPQRTSRSRLRPIAESIRHARRPARIAAQSATT